MQGFRKVICITQYIIFFLIFTSNSIFSEPTGDEFTLKLLKRTGENFFSNLAYECNDCTFEQFEALKPPRGWVYSSRIINENLELNSNGIAEVLAIRAKPSSVWEKR